MASDGLNSFRLRRVSARQRASRVPPSGVPAVDFVNKAKDLDAIKKAVEDAAAVGAPLWLSYLFLLFYIAIAAAAVTHKDLLLENPVELPFLSVKLPLKAFFVVAPILFVIVHAYVMAHFALLADKAKCYHDQLRSTVRCEDANDHFIREGLRRQLPINLFVQFLAGPLGVREGPFSVLLWAVAWTTLVAGPILALLLLLIQFLPYHDTRVSWWHRGMLILDLVFIWWLWMKILAGRDNEMYTEASLWTRFWNGLLRFSREVLAIPLTGIIVLFSVLIATFPGEWKEWPYRAAPRLERKEATEFVFGKVGAQEGVETGSWPTNTLRLRELDLLEALKIEEPDKLKWKRYSFSLSNRHLEQADFQFVKFDNIDLREAHLEGAWLDNAHLAIASLDHAWLEGASLRNANLQGASFDGAHLEGAWLNWAKLYGAAFNGAHLEGAILNWADLRGVAFIGSYLQAASLKGAKALGGAFVGANLQGAYLGWTDLQGANFLGSEVEAIDLSEAFLWRTKRSINERDMEMDSASIVAAAALINKARSEGAVINPNVDNSDVKHVMIGSARNGPTWKNSSWKPVSSVKDHPSPWTGNDYRDLRDLLLNSTREGDQRYWALAFINSLNCSKGYSGLGSCNSKALEQRSVQDWRAALESAQIDEAAYERVLAQKLRELICSSDRDAINILRGVASGDEPAAPGGVVLKGSRLSSTGVEAPPVINYVMSPNCPVHSELTEADRAKLVKIKAHAPERSPSSPAPSRR